MSDLLSDLARAKAAFQQRAVLAVIGAGAPVLTTDPVINPPKPGVDDRFSADPVGKEGG